MWEAVFLFTFQTQSTKYTAYHTHAWLIPWLSYEHDHIIQLSLSSRFCLILGYSWNLGTSLSSDKFRIGNGVYCRVIIVRIRSEVGNSRTEIKNGCDDQDKIVRSFPMIPRGAGRKWCIFGIFDSINSGKGNAGIQFCLFGGYGS